MTSLRDLLRRRADQLPRAVQLAEPVDLHPVDAGRADLPDPAVRLHRPQRRRGVRRVLPDRQRGAVLRDPVPVRDGATRSPASATAQTLGHRAGHPGPTGAAVPRPLAAGGRSTASSSRCSAWSSASLLLGVHIPVTAWLPLGRGRRGRGRVVHRPRAASTPRWRLRVRETAVLSNVLFGVLLIFCGVNVALDSLPGWMATVGRLAAADARHRGRPRAGRRGVAGLGRGAGRHRGCCSGWCTARSAWSRSRLLEVEGRRRATLEIQ